MEEAQKILEVKDLCRIFSDGTKALDGVSFHAQKGDFIVVAGSNGSGKSVLMSLIAGLDEPTSGRVEIQKGFEAGLSFQDADAQILGQTPYEDVMFGAKGLGLPKNQAAQIALGALEKVGLLDKKDFNARTLSGGEKRRLCVAGILALGRELIIFDEPFANLDWPGVQQTTAIMRDLKAQKKTVIVLTHEIEKVLALANRLIVLDKGKIRFDGSPADGLKFNLEECGIKNPLNSYKKLEDLQW
ncbi:MAG: ABC transporter ATP-binding protein [Treponema sp.]|nr:ABC transporter ATP-binding protein [Treponema sp.]